MRPRALFVGRWKLLMDANAVLLFDLENDPGERRDLAARHPDKMLMLRQLYTAWENDVRQEGRRR